MTNTDSIDPAEVAALPQLSSTTRDLPVRLTDEAWAGYCERSAAAFDELTTLHDAEKARRAGYNSMHKARVDEHARLAGIVHAKAEEQSVAVITYGDLDQNQAITVRTDTYEVLERDALDASERERLLQGDMFDGDAGTDTDTDTDTDGDSEDIVPEDVDLAEDGAERSL